MKREKIACSCHNVSYGKIIDAVHAGAEHFTHTLAFLSSFLQDMKRFPEDYQQ